LGLKTADTHTHTPDRLLAEELVERADRDCGRAACGDTELGGGAPDEIETDKCALDGDGCVLGAGDLESNSFDCSMLLPKSGLVTPNPLRLLTSPKPPVPLVDNSEVEGAGGGGEAADIEAIGAGEVAEEEEKEEEAVADEGAGLRGYEALVVVGAAAAAKSPVK